MARLSGKRITLDNRGKLSASVGAGGAPSDLVRLEDLAEDQPLSLVVQLFNPVNVGIGLLNFNASVLVTVQRVTGAGITVIQKFFATGIAPRPLRLEGCKSVYVSAQLVTPNLGNPYDPTLAPPAAGAIASCDIQLSVDLSNVDFLGEDFAVWDPSFTVDSRFSVGNPAGGPGKLLDIQGGVLNMGGASTLYLWMFDSLDAKLSASTTFTVTAPGTGYTSPPTVNFTFPSGSRGPSIQVPIAVATIGGGAVTGITLTFQGQGILQVPTGVILTGGGGTGATATITTSLSLVPSMTQFPTIGPFFAPGPFSFGDEVKPALYFQAGFSWGLSSSPPGPGYVNAPNAQAWVDAKVAQ